MVAVSALGLLIPFLGSADALAQRAQPLAGSCTVNAQFPHVSSTAGKGIDAKSSFGCDGSATANVTNVLINLYLCSSAPPQGTRESDWGNYGCAVVSQAAYTDVGVVSANNKPVRMVPKSGSGEAHGNGYWAQCTQWAINGVSQTRVGSINPNRLSA